MRQVVDRGRRSGELLADRGKDLLRARRERWPRFDHVVRALERYLDRRGNRLAASITCYAFLSFFPLLALGYSLLGYLVGVSAQARDYFVGAINSLLPGLAQELQVEEIAQTRTTVGVIGLAALLITGQNWVQVLRESLRLMFGNEAVGGANFFVKRFWDVSVLAFLGVVLVCGVAVSTVATSATSTVLGWVGLQDVPGASLALRALSLTVAISFNTVIFLVLFTRLSGTRASARSILRGALIGAAGFELLKQVGTLLVMRTTENPVYGAFAVLVGLMVWINLVSRFVLLVAAWTATRLPVLSEDARNPDNVADEEEVEVLLERAETHGATSADDTPADGTPDDGTPDDETPDDGAPGKNGQGHGVRAEPPVRG